MFSAAALNALANSPGVLEFIAPGYANIDLTKFTLGPTNRMFGNKYGAILFADRKDGTYEMHYLLTRRYHGRAGLKLIRKALAFLFTTTEATAIVGQTPRDNLAARRVNRAIGGAAIGSCIDTSGRPCVIYKLGRKKWAELSAEFSGASAV